MNTKIIVALIFGIALLCLTGAAAAGEISSHTEIFGTHLTSEFTLSTTGINVNEVYTSILYAEFVDPIFPPADVCIIENHILGSDYTASTEISSSPTTNSVSTSVSDPSEVVGSIAWWSCVEWGQGYPPQSIPLPYEGIEIASYEWVGTHPEGSVYPAHSTESHYISWP